jgi:glycosyltransferase involved in cell wall biosynthesis
MASPRVTIGLPVFNGAATMGFTIDSLLAQTFSDFELLISDNASTDATAEVAQDYARRDPRVRYVRQPVNLGGNGNYSFVARDARGELLKWCSCSDWCAPTFLERCVEALDTDPAAVLAAPRTRLFKGDLGQAEDYGEDIEISESEPLLRLQALLARLRLNNAFNGVIRLSALRRTPLVEPYLLGDIVLMGHLALLGRFLLLPEPLFYRRMEVATSTALQDRDAQLRHLFPVPTARTLLQTWKLHRGWLRAGLEAPMAPGERVRVLGMLLRRCAWDRRPQGG